MKRSMDLVRIILMVYEATPKDSDVWCWNEIPEIPGFHKEEIEYHIAIMRDVGLLHTNCITIPDRGEMPLGIRMTWEGHDFLEASRDETRWKKAKETAGKVGVFTLDILKQILTQLIQSQLKQVMG